MIKKIEIRTSKRYIVANQYQANQDSILIIASATGVKQSFYKKFAEFISSNGTTVITFDYFGIGLSIKEPINQNNSNISEWGTEDLEAIILYARKKFPNSKITLLGHSIGGQLIGFAKSSSNVEKIILISAQSGYWKHWEGFNKIKMFTNWYFFFPLLTKFFGYFPARKFSGMENLPKNVAKQWSLWGRNSNYFLNDFSDNNLYFKNIEAKITAISIENDNYAPKKAVEWLTKKFHNAKVKELHLKAIDYQSNEIGHFGIFREKFKSNLWKLLLNEVEK